MTIHLNARLDENRREDGHKSWTLFAEGYPYSFGKVSLTDKGQFKVWGLRRDDRGWWPNADDVAPFATLADALSHVRQMFETAMARYHTQCAEVMGVLNQGLSKVERYKTEYPEDTMIVVGIGRNEEKLNDGGWRQFTMILTPQEAITALDYLYKRDGSTVRILGAITDKKHTTEYNTGYAQWLIPVSSNDYHLLDWRSREGVGRKG